MHRLVTKLSYSSAITELNNNVQGYFPQQTCLVNKRKSGTLHLILFGDINPVRRQTHGSTEIFL